MVYFTTLPVKQVVGKSIKSNVLPVHHTMKAWVGSKAQSGHFKNEKIFPPAGSRNPDRSIRVLVTTPIL